MAEKRHTRESLRHNMAKKGSGKEYLTPESQAERAKLAAEYEAQQKAAKTKSKPKK